MLKLIVISSDFKKATAWEVKKKDLKGLEQNWDKTYKKILIKAIELSSSKKWKTSKQYEKALKKFWKNYKKGSKKKPPKWYPFYKEKDMRLTIVGNKRFYRFSPMKDANKKFIKKVIKDYLK